MESHRDERGYFGRTWCKKEFEKRGLNTNIVQCNLSHNLKKSTLRGMHYQRYPYEEAKIVSCVSGAIYDVVVDIRPDSPTFKEWISIELSEENKQMLYISEGFAHGFQTLEDETTVYYQMSEYYCPEHAAGFRYNDPCFNIKWPADDNVIISKRDLSFEDFSV